MAAWAREATVRDDRRQHARADVPALVPRARHCPSSRTDLGSRLRGARHPLADPLRDGRRPATDLVAPGAEPAGRPRPRSTQAPTVRPRRRSHQRRRRGVAEHRDARGRPGAVTAPVPPTPHAPPAPAGQRDTGSGSGRGPRAAAAHGGQPGGATQQRTPRQPAAPADPAHDVREAGRPANAPEVAIGGDEAPSTPTTSPPVSDAEYRRLQTSGDEAVHAASDRNSVGASEERRCGSRRSSSARTRSAPAGRPALGFDHTRSTRRRSAVRPGGQPTCSS